ncbi:DUF4376 domain-containing protein [Azonexus sp.]|uniref:DUF4376 domain-containing protein n=1 Tax=Azonexus sp. TaxID=1872668 RepID=UPI0027B9BA17|nr:DUF4376 domain-containing protein [Azonexus sp.]
MMEVIDVKNCVWGALAQTINCNVLFGGFDDYIPFSASPDDTEAHGVSIYNRVLAGEFGPIGLYIAPQLTAPQLVDAVNARRDALETQGFPHAGLWFQSDERSVARINSTALAAVSALMGGQNPAFPDWIAADNTPLQVDAAGVLALQASLTAHAGALHAHARVLKAAINAATSIDELSMIDIDAGWP